MQKSLQCIVLSKSLPSLQLASYPPPFKGELPYEMEEGTNMNESSTAVSFSSLLALLEAIGDFFKSERGSRLMRPTAIAHRVFLPGLALLLFFTLTDRADAQTRQVLAGSTLSPGFGMGVNSSGGNTHWLTNEGKD